MLINILAYPLNRHVFVAIFSKIISNNFLIADFGHFDDAESDEDYKIFIHSLAGLQTIRDWD